MGRVRAVPRLCELYPGIWLTPEEKAGKNVSQGCFIAASIKVCVLDVLTVRFTSFGKAVLGGCESFGSWAYTRETDDGLYKQIPALTC